MPAPRGRILDRNGRVIVDNRLSLGVTIDWQRYIKLAPDYRGQLLDRLAVELTRADPSKPMHVEDLVHRLNDLRFSRFRPIPVAQDVPEEVAIFLAEHRADFPTVVATRNAVRNYPYGSLLSHALGYVGSLSDQQWRFIKQHQDPAKPYDQNDRIGKTGVEATMEKELRGTPGQVSYEVDARNQLIREVGHRDPIPGNDLWLTIDLKQQALTEESLQAGLIRARKKTNSLGAPPAPAGSSVLEDPRNGQILAMASYPTFSPADFSNGITSKRYKELTAPGNFLPLTNRAVDGTYAPGSTFKLATAYAGLEARHDPPRGQDQRPGLLRHPRLRWCFLPEVQLRANPARQCGPPAGNHRLERRVLLQTRLRHLGGAAPAARRHGPPERSERPGIRTGDRDRAARRVQGAAAHAGLAPRDDRKLNGRARLTRGFGRRA